MALLSQIFRQRVVGSAKQLHSTLLKDGVVALSFSKWNHIRKTNLNQVAYYSTATSQHRRNICLSVIRPAESNGKTKPDITYEELVTLIESSNIQLFDVREPKELASSGQIPKAINIPLRQIPNALNLSPEKFKVLFGVEKPEESEEIVFFCLLGKRSLVAREIAKAVGYARARHYPGGWMEWEEKQK